MSRQKSSPRTRFAAAAIAAAAAVGVGTLSPPPTADAQPFSFYVAVAYSFRSDVGAVGRSTAEDGARIAALQACQDKGGNHCVWFGTARNVCIALAVLGAQEWVTKNGIDVQSAEQNALAANPGGRIAASGCALQSPTSNPPTKPRPTIVPPVPAEQ
ncbi:DUF4189 domain-containing protein [Mycobacterium deserti]|uniref:DUF4189 domain-containing protein n=1 Tax=Mycobacterium deserti TaxID=2978347 RepID=A0ABT2MGM4_9MYCO|nr:DUF4189 domain-containing protein [Mycobacterium deserti]MCT7661431.1 DUF4189 domain-containing protein [Mycobacterium deserti]